MQKPKQDTVQNERLILSRYVLGITKATAQLNVLYVVLQLEQTVTKLQTALDFTPEEVAALPPPLLRIRELEQDNARLEKENEELRRMLSDGSMDLSRRNSPSAFPEARICDRDFKRRKMGGEGLYMVCSELLLLVLCIL
jgi:hypothetical protein